MEQNNEGVTTSFEVFDDEPDASANNSDESPDKHLSPFEKLRKNDEPKIMEPDTISYGRLTALEAKLSKAMTEIDKLKTTIKLERALTGNKITDAVTKARLGE